MGRSILEKSNCVNLVVSVAAEKNGKFLMVEEAKKGIRGLWNFPSGKMEFGESVTDAALREFEEETGFEVELTGFVGVYEYMWDDGKGVTVRFNFYGKIKEDMPQKTLADDVLSVKWMSKKELKELAASDRIRFAGTKKMIADVLAGKKTDLDSLYTTSGPIR